MIRFLWRTEKDEVEPSTNDVYAASLLVLLGSKLAVALQPRCEEPRIPLRQAYPRRPPCRAVKTGKLIDGDRCGWLARVRHLIKAMLGSYS